MARIVISYRRADSAGVTGRIFDHLEAHFGRDSVFMDIDNIPLGSDFRDHIHKTLKSCDVLLAIIGPNWLDEANANRLSDVTDWVRIEIEAALGKKIPVIPVLIDQAQIPPPDALPRSLRELAFRQAARVDSGIDFRPHMERLIRALGECISSAVRARAALAATQPIAKPADDQPRKSALAADPQPAQDSAGPSSDARRRTAVAGGKKRPVPGLSGQVEVAGDTAIKVDDFQEKAKSSSPPSPAFSAAMPAAALDVAAPRSVPDPKPAVRPQSLRSSLQPDYSAASASAAGAGHAVPLNNFRPATQVADAIDLREQVMGLGRLLDAFMKGAANAVVAPFARFERTKIASAADVPALESVQAPALSAQPLQAATTPLHLPLKATRFELSGSQPGTYLEKMRGLLAPKRRSLVIGAAGLVILGSIALLLLPSEKNENPTANAPLPPAIRQAQPAGGTAAPDTKQTVLEQPAPLQAGAPAPSIIIKKPVAAAPANLNPLKSQPAEMATDGDGAQAADNAQAAPAAPNSATDMTADEITAAFVGTWKFDNDPLQGWTKSKESGWKSFTIAKINGSDLKVTGDFPSPGAICDYDFDTGHIAGNKITMAFVCSYIVGSTHLTLEAQMNDPTHIVGTTGDFQKDGIAFPTSLVRWTATKQ